MKAKQSVNLFSEHLRSMDAKKNVKYVNYVVVVVYFTLQIGQVVLTKPENSGKQTFT